MSHGNLESGNVKHHTKQDRRKKTMAQKQSNTTGSTIIRINEAQIKEYLGEIVKRAVRETLNMLLDEDAARLRRIAGTRWGMPIPDRWERLKDGTESIEA